MHSGKTQSKFGMALMILFLIFCGAMYLLDRMLCGFVKKMSNSKKMKR